MAWPIVVVASGGLPVTEAANGFGTPVEAAANGYGTAVTLVSSGGIPVVGTTPPPPLDNFRITDTGDQRVTNTGDIRAVS
jgi:hypothetical protein